MLSCCCDYLSAAGDQLSIFLIRFLSSVGVITVTWQLVAINDQPPNERFLVTSGSAVFQQVCQLILTLIRYTLFCNLIQSAMAHRSLTINELRHFRDQSQLIFKLHALPISSKALNVHNRNGHCNNMSWASQSKLFALQLSLSDCICVVQGELEKEIPVQVLVTNQPAVDDSYLLTISNVSTVGRY